MFNEIMSEDLTLDTPVYSRQRVQNFNNSEVQLLMNLVDKYKHVILHKMRTAKACEAKDMGWQQLTKEFNSHHLGKERTAESLRTKFKNIGTGQYLNCPQDDDFPFRKEMYDRVKALNAAIEKGDSKDAGLSSGEFINVKPNLTLDKSEFDVEKDSIFNDKMSDEESSGDKLKIRSNTKNKNKIKTFTLRECQLLLKCVKEEKRILFSPMSPARKRQAWKRVCESYNNQTDRPRTWIELQRRFQTMKSVTSRISKTNAINIKKKEKYETFNNSTPDSNIKMEILTDTSDCNDDDKSHKSILIEVNTSSYVNNDPLTTNAQSLDSGLGLSESTSNNNDDNRIQQELWNYKMETAKMERKRLEMAIKAEQSERETRAVEMSLKLRTARLELLAAEAKFDPDSPSLAYTAQEARCQVYMQEFMHNSG